MLRKLILLCLSTISLAHDNIIHVAKDAQAAGSSIQESSSSRAQTMNLLDKVGKKRKTSADAESSYLAETSANHRKVEPLTTQKRFEIMKNWSKNQDKLVSLNEDSKKLSVLSAKLVNKLPKLDFIKEIFDPVATIYSITDAIELLEKLIERLATLKEIRFLELGKIDLPNSNANLVETLLESNDNLPLTKLRMDPSEHAELPVNKPRVDLSKIPGEIIELIAKKTWLNDGNLMVDELKEIVKVNQILIIDPLFRDISILYPSLKSTLPLFWKCALKTLDFLFNNELASTSSVGTFFQDAHIMREVIQYTGYRFLIEIPDSIYWGPPSLTEHWYWPMLHDSFKALSKEQEIMLSAYVLLEFQQNHMLKLSQDYFPYMHAPWEAFFKSFDSQLYLKLLAAPADSPDRLSAEAREAVRNQVRRIVDIISDRNDRFMQVINSGELIRFGHHLGYILDLFETHVFPGILEEVLSTHPNSYDFDNRFKLIQINSKIHDLRRQAGGFYRYIQREHPDSWSTSSVYQSKFNEFLAKMILAFKEHKMETWRLTEKRKGESNSSRFYRDIITVEQKIDDIVKDFQSKSRTFVTPKT